MTEGTTLWTSPSHSNAPLDTTQYSIVFCLWQVKSEAPMGAHATELINQ